MEPARSDTVLLVDDDPNILAGLRRHLAGRFNIACAHNGDEALKLVSGGEPVAVAVCDMRMPGMTGLELLQRLRVVAPDTVRMMLTGNGDQRTATEAINQGNVFRFFTKPCSLASLTEGIEAGIRQYELITAERRLLSGTVVGSVRMLTEILSLVAPETFQRGQRLYRWAGATAAEMRLDDSWCLETAALLAGIGFVAVPAEVIARQRTGHALTDAEQSMLRNVPEIGASLIANVPRLERVAKVVATQRGRFDSGEPLLLEARLLHALMVVDDECGGALASAALARLDRFPGLLDPVAVVAVRAALGRMADEAAPTRVHMLTAVAGLLPGDELEGDLLLANGRLVLAAGERITDTVFVRLRNLAKMFSFEEPVRVSRPQNSERQFRWQ